MNVNIILNLVTSYFNMQLAHCSYSRQISIPKFTLFIVIGNVGNAYSSLIQNFDASSILAVAFVSVEFWYVCCQRKCVISAPWYFSTVVCINYYVTIYYACYVHALLLQPKYKYALLCGCCGTRLKYGLTSGLSLSKLFRVTDRIPYFVP